jgi:hypothetical protein
MVAKMLSLVKVSENCPVLEYTSSLDKRISWGVLFQGVPKAIGQTKGAFLIVYGSLGTLVCNQPETLQVIIPLDVRFPLPSRARMHRMHI